MEKVFVTSSYMERTLVSSFQPWLPALKPCKQPSFLTFVILSVNLLAPARTKVSESFSTSLCLMTVTIFSSPELLVEVCSTHHGFAYSNLLVSVGLQAFMDHKSIDPIYLYVALFSRLNIGIFEFLSFVLGFNLFG